MAIAAIAAPMAMNATMGIKADTPRQAAGYFRDSIPDIQNAMNAGQIGGARVLDDIQAGIRSFGRGVEGAWNASVDFPNQIQESDRHNMLIDMKNLAVFEGAARVAHQRTGHMNIPQDQYDNLYNAVDSARNMAAILERV